MAAKRLNLPDTASVAISGDDGRLFAPSAARNAQAILDVVSAYVPVRGRALEIASGTGEHIVRYAAEFPNISWQPTDVDPARIRSIESWANQNPCENLCKPVLMDATTPGWSGDQAPLDLIILVNLLHLISEAEVSTLLTEAAAALAPNGVFLIYGPFLRGDQFASASDRQFHNSLRSQDPEIGYKSFQDIQTIQRDSGLPVEPEIAMPASNLMLAGRKPA